MAKNKKKKAQMFKNFLAFKAGQGSTQEVVQSSFQTPHGDQEKLTELIDDNSGGGPSKPGGSGININPIQKISKWTALKPAEDSTQQINRRQDPKRPNLTIVEGKASKIHLVMDKSKISTQPSNSPKPVEEPKPNTLTMVAPIVTPQRKKQPIIMPTQQTIAQPTKQPIIMPTQKPIAQPTKQPIVMPTQQPIAQPTKQPIVMPTQQPIAQPTKQPIVMPTQQPIAQPSQQPINLPLPKQALTSIAPANVKRYPSFTMPHPGGALGRGYPAGIPRSMLVNQSELKQSPIQTVSGVQKTHPVSFIREEESPSAQTNSQAEQAERRNKPIWDLAPHAKPTWPTQGAPMYAESGFGWPQSPATPSTPAPSDNYWPPPGQGGNDLSGEVDMNATNPPQAYSPSDVYSESAANDQGADEELESPDILPSGSKRLSAFQRLGPMAEQPKKTKLTINLLCQKDVRNVVDETDDIPTHLRDYMTTSTDEIVIKYLEMWPFKKNFTPARTATARQSKSVMMLETEYMEEAYTRDNRFILVAVTGYPPNWKKEDVLDAVLDSVKGMSFIPCFVEFTKVQCRFLVIRCRLALLTIHKYGFIIHKNDTELIVSLSNIHLSLNQLDFVPRLTLRKLLLSKLDGGSLDLSNFTLKNDISHFVYFPLHRISNQTELIQLQSSVPWSSLTNLNLSHNKITSLRGIDLLRITPQLKHLNLSHNCIEKATMLLQCRNLPLKTIHLEGNPLCNDYIEQEHYIKVLTMLFTGLVEIDGVKIRQTHALIDPQRNYCPEDSKHIIDKVLEVMYPLLDAPPEQRFLIEELYDADAVMTITFMYKLRYGAIYKDHRNLFIRARVMDEGDMESIVSASNITKIITRWPDMIHDPSTFNVDVLYHSESTTIVRIGGIVKITTESLADEEHLLSFTRTLVLHTKDGYEYKITNELLYWDLPEKNYAETAFQITRVRPKNLKSRLDAPPDEELKEKLLHVFMQITELGKEPSERCLEEKDWNLKHALEYFSKLLKLDNLDPIMSSQHVNQY